MDRFASWKTAVVGALATLSSAWFSRTPAAAWGLFKVQTAGRVLFTRLSTADQ